MRIGCPRALGVWLQRPAYASLRRGIVAHFPRDRRRPKVATLGRLGRQDSNLEMLFAKMPFEMSGGFRLISEHIGTRDFSRVRCANNEMQLPGALAPTSQIQPVSDARISDIGQQRKAFGDPLDAWSDLECPLRRVRRSRILPFGQRIAPTHHGLARDMTAAYYASVPIRCTNAPWIDHGPQREDTLETSTR